MIIKGTGTGSPVIGSLLRQFRKQSGTGLGEAAAVIGRDRSALSRIESGERGMPLPDLRRLFQEHGVSGEEQDPRLSSGPWAAIRGGGSTRARSPARFLST